MIIFYLRKIVNVCKFMRIFSELNGYIQEILLFLYIWIKFYKNLIYHKSSFKYLRVNRFFIWLNGSIETIALFLSYIIYF